MTDLYEILNLTKEASKEEIRKAWIILSKKYHPDKDGDKEKMAAINNAYDILYNEAKRERYDKTGTTKDLSFEARFHAVLSPIIAGIVDNTDPATIDLITELRANVSQMKMSTIQQQKLIDKRINNAQQILNRIVSDGSGKLEQILNAQLFEAQRTKVLIEEDLFLLTQIAEILEKYGYDFTENRGFQLEWSPISFNIK